MKTASGSLDYHLITFLAQDNLCSTAGGGKPAAFRGQSKNVRSELTLTING